MRHVRLDTFVVVASIVAALSTGGCGGATDLPGAPSPVDTGWSALTGEEQEIARTAHLNLVFQHGPSGTTKPPRLPVLIHADAGPAADFLPDGAQLWQTALAPYLPSGVVPFQIVGSSSSAVAKLDYDWPGPPGEQTSDPATCGGANARRIEGNVVVEAFAHFAFFARPNECARSAEFMKETVAHELGHILMHGTHSQTGIMSTRTAQGSRWFVPPAIARAMGWWLTVPPATRPV